MAGYPTREQLLSCSCTKEELSKLQQLLKGINEVIHAQNDSDSIAAETLIVSVDVQNTKPGLVWDAPKIWSDLYTYRQLFPELSSWVQDIADGKKTFKFSLEQVNMLRMLTTSVDAQLCLHKLYQVTATREVVSDPYSALIDGINLPTEPKSLPAVFDTASRLKADLTRLHDYIPDSGTIDSQGRFLLIVLVASARVSDCFKDVRVCTCIDSALQQLSHSLLNMVFHSQNSWSSTKIELIISCQSTIRSLKSLSNFLYSPSHALAQFCAGAENPVTRDWLRTHIWLEKDQAQLAYINSISSLVDRARREPLVTDQWSLLTLINRQLQWAELGEVLHTSLIEFLKSVIVSRAVWDALLQQLARLLLLQANIVHDSMKKRCADWHETMTLTRIKSNQPRISYDDLTAMMALIEALVKGVDDSTVTASTISLIKCIRILSSKLDYDHDGTTQFGESFVQTGICDKATVLLSLSLLQNDLTSLERNAQNRQRKRAIYVAACAVICTIPALIVAVLAYVKEDCCS